MFRSALKKLRLFDVTMTSGNLLPNMLYNKKQLLKRIVYENTPDKVEIGFFDNFININNFGHPSSGGPRQTRKISLSDTLQLYNYSKQLKQNIKNPCLFYTVVPVDNNFLKILALLNVDNISINTSISETHLKTYMKVPLDKTKEILTENFKKGCMFKNVKLYVSCISTCSIEGKQNPSKVIDEILYYNSLGGINDICLYDNYGLLKFYDLKSIVDILSRNMNIDKLNMRLYNPSTYDRENIYNNEKIINYCIENNIYKFDVINEVINDTVSKNKNNILTYGDIYNDEEFVNAYGVYCNG
jgi:hypothetical protein